MAIQVTGKNIDLGSALRSYVSDKVEKAFERYGRQGLSANVFVEKAHGNFKTTCTVHLTSGLSLQSHGSADEAHPSVDEAIDRLEKRLRRYKRRLKNHHQASADKAETALNAIDYIIRHNEDDETDDAEFAPAIIAETQTAIHELSVGDAVMQMDWADKAFLIFKNASHGRLNVVYRREDGHIGWIDPGGLLAKADRKR
jgi:ribosomal subunit interface protein